MSTTAPPTIDSSKEEFFSYHELPESWPTILSHRRHYQTMLEILSQPKVVPPMTIRSIVCRILRETPISESSFTTDLLVLDEYLAPLNAAEAYVEGKISKKELKKAYSKYSDMLKIIQTRLGPDKLHIKDLLDKTINPKDELIAAANMIRAAYLTCIEDGIISLWFSSIVNNVNSAVKFSTFKDTDWARGELSDHEKMVRDIHMRIVADHDIHFE